jgi:hypothetical protein
LVIHYPIPDNLNKDMHWAACGSTSLRSKPVWVVVS